MHYDSRFYNKDNLFSRKAMLYFSIGGRGTGKTTCAKMWCIDDFIKHKKRFMWIRRYGTEINGDKRKGVIGCKQNFFEKIKKYYPKIKLEIKGQYAYINGEVAGCFVALSTSSALKGVDFPNTNKIIFDEFLIPKGSIYRYMNDEVNTLLDLISTVFRPILNSKGEEELDGKVWLLANAITFGNDYFFYFDIKPFSNTYYYNKEKGIVVEQYQNKLHADSVRGTKFGKLIKGTRYESMAVDNKYYLDNNDFIGHKTSNAELIFNIRYLGSKWGIYADSNFIYVTNKYDKTRLSFTFTKDDHSIDSILVKSIHGTRFELLIRYFQLGLVLFENTMIKRRFLDFMSLFVVR